MKSLEQLCVPRPSVFDPSKRDTVLSLTHLAMDRIDGPAFLEENHITDGMRTLLLEAFRRLQGNSEQAVFKLTQAMGGGKTHNLITLGLLRLWRVGRCASKDESVRERWGRKDT